MRSELNVEEREFSIGGLRLVGRHWRKPGAPLGPPLIALHGWLDNAGSFDRLAQELGVRELLALDLAGHGRSAHRWGLGAYNIWQDVAEVLDVAQQMNWPSFALLGHSRGAAIAMVLAAVRPEAVVALIGIDAIAPHAAPAREAAKQLAHSIGCQLAPARGAPYYYPTLNAAVAARARGRTKLSMEDAAALAVRGVGRDADGFFWANDAKLLLPSEVKFTPEQVDAFLRALELPVLVLMADRGMLINDASVCMRVRGLTQGSVKVLSGGHHLHMSENATGVAEAVEHFLAERARRAG